ncbi:MAG: ComEC/Rec2 family competence protein, partial [Synergistaceae bacterium]|nr:ComEC/Rec2 family competence protein [Synergistaceae bacterium]
MILLARAPFLPVLAGLAAMLALSGRAAPWALPLVALLSTTGVLLCSFSTDLKGQWGVAALTLVLSLLFAFWLAFSLHRRPHVPPFVNVVGTVVQTRPWGRLYLAVVKTPQGSFVLRTPHENLTEGGRVRVDGVLSPFSGAPLDGSPNRFHEGRYWLARGVTAKIVSPRFERLPGGGWNIHRWRHGLRRLLAIHVPRLTGAYLDAAWTGRRSAELENMHRALGTSHLLAISGFHVGVVMGAASFVFRRGKRRALCLTLLLWFYVFLTGASAGALRAALMIQVALGGELVGRPASAVNSVSLAAVLLLSSSPFWFWDVGWRLSMLGAFTIAVYLERGSAKGLGGLCISPLIWFVTFPQAAGTFGSVPAAGLPLNLVAPLFFAFTLSVASGIALLALLGVPGAALFLNVMENVFLLWEAAANTVADLIPWQVEWNFYLAYTCVFFSAMSLCRAFFIPWGNAMALTALAVL